MDFNLQVLINTIEQLRSDNMRQYPEKFSYTKKGNIENLDNYFTYLIGTAITIGLIAWFFSEFSKTFGIGLAILAFMFALFGVICKIEASQEYKKGVEEAYYATQKAKKNAEDERKRPNIKDSTREYLNFSVTTNEKLAKYIALNENSHKFIIAGREEVYNYSQLVSFEYAENGHNDTITQMTIIVTINPGAVTYNIRLLDAQTKKGSILYNLTKSNATQLIGYLKSIEQYNLQHSSEQSKTNTDVDMSVPEKIKKYKELLDCGAITQEEYDAKKKQLLGL